MSTGSDAHVLRALRAGAAGFLLKDTPPAEIVAAVRQVARNNPVLSPAVTRRLIARVAEFPSLAAHGETQEEALREIKDVVGFVLNDLTESGEPLPEPFGKRSFSGRLVLRMPEYMHRQLALEAMQQGISLNQLLNLKLEGAR